jgi:hypothetical protein
MNFAQPRRAAAFNDWAKAQGWPSRCDVDLAFESQKLAGLLAIWRLQAGRDPLPRREKLSARILKPYLGSLALFQQIQGNPKRYCIRLMGTLLTQTIGEMQGKYVDEMVPPDLLPRWHAAFDLILAECRPLRFTSRVDFMHLDHLHAEVLLAPLLDGRYEPSLVLGCAVFKSATAPNPQ